jgi:hypothetical protein
MYIRNTLVLSLLLSAFKAVAGDIIKIDSKSGDIMVLKDSPAVLDLLTELNSETNLTITASSEIRSFFIIDEGTYSLDSLVRVLDSQYSTVKGFDSTGNLKSIGVLPLGKPAIASFLEPVNEIVEARSHLPLVPDEPTLASESFDAPDQIDIDNLSEADWRSLSPEEAAAVKRKLAERQKSEAEKREAEEKLKEDMEFMNSLEEVRKSNPEFYEVLSERHKTRIQRIRAERND